MSRGTEYACFIFVNDNLKMGTGKKMVQGCHGMIDLMRFLPDQKDYVKSCFDIWLNTGHKTITLRATEAQMEELYDSYPSVKIHDAGRTQVAPNSFTVLALYPKVHDPEEFKAFKLIG